MRGLLELSAQGDHFVDLIFRKRLLDDDCVLLLGSLAL